MTSKTQAQFTLYKRMQHVRTMQMATTIAAFFIIAWTMLQWALATESAYTVGGAAREFVQLEAMVCALAAAGALLVAAINGVAWMRFSVAKTPHRRMLQNA